MTDDAARSGRDIRFTGWVNQESATAWLAHASLLIFPSRGPESLSRVLIEASALGIPIAAMNTGGTADIIVHGETGLLSATPEALADDVRRLRGDEDLRRRLADAARLRAERLFDAASVTGRFEALYADLHSKQTSHRDDDSCRGRRAIRLSPARRRRAGASRLRSAALSRRRRGSRRR